MARRYSTTAASTNANATAHKTIAGTSLTVFPYIWEPLPVVVRAGGLFDESGPRVCLTLAAREVRPATPQRCVKTTPVMVAVYFSVRSVRFSVTFHQYRTRFHFFNQPPIPYAGRPFTGSRPGISEDLFGVSAKATDTLTLKPREKPLLQKESACQRPLFVQPSPSDRRIHNSEICHRSMINSQNCRVCRGMVIAIPGNRIP